MNVGQPSTAVQFYRQGLNGSSRVVMNTYTLERFLNIIHKSLKLYSEFGEAFGKVVAPSLINLSNHLKNSLDVLLAVQIVPLVEQLTCPDENGTYFLRRATWVKIAGRISLLCYSILTKIKLAEKFGFIRIKEISLLGLKQLALLKVVRLGFYAIYCGCKAIDGIRSRNWLKATTSFGKIFVIIATLALYVLQVQTAAPFLALSSLSLSLDCICMARIIRIV